MLFLVWGSTPSWQESFGYGKESLLVPIRTQCKNTKGITTNNCTSQQEGILSRMKVGTPSRVKKVLAAARAGIEERGIVRWPQGAITEVSMSEILPLLLYQIKRTRRYVAVCLALQLRKIM